MNEQKYIRCGLCGAKIKDSESNNAEPLISGRCCGKCNAERVIPARLLQLQKNK